MKNGKLKKTVFVLSIVAGGAILALGVIAALCSTAITLGMAVLSAAGILLILWGIVRLKRFGPAIKQKALRRFVAVSACVGLAVLLFLEALILSAMVAPNQNLEPKFVLVLGCGIFPDGRLTNSLKSRLDCAYDLLNKHPYALCIVSGGKGENEPFAEAQAMGGYLAGRGIDKKRIITEPNSRNTAQNMQYSSSIIESCGGGATAVVTNDYHVYRALVTAKRYGIDAFGVGAPTDFRVLIPSHIRECIGLIKEAVFSN